MEYEQLLEKYKGLFLTALSKSHHSYHAKDDIYQELCIKLWNCQKQYQERVSEKHFHNIVSNMINNHMGDAYKQSKRLKNRPTKALNPETADRRTHINYDEKLAQIYKKFVPQLPPSQQEAFLSQLTGAPMSGAYNSRRCNLYHAKQMLLAYLDNGRIEV